MKEVIKTLHDLKDHESQKSETEPNRKTKKRRLYSCYNCGEPGHWRKTCPKGFRKRGRPPRNQGGPTSSTKRTDTSTTTEETKKLDTGPAPKQTRKAKPASKP